MIPVLLATFTTTDAVVAGIGVAMLIGLYLAFRVVEFILHKLMIVAALLALGLAAWWYYATNHVSF